MRSKSTPAILDFRRRLTRWYRRHGRDLPWRRTRDPYAVLVSEFMLQQTQVSRVEGFYHRFLARFPTVHHLAGAAHGEVREVWQGLGYYRRADNLHRLAQAVVERHEGRIPAESRVLMRLPGVGRYTAGAIATFAFERAEPAVDTNVARVIRRAFHPRARGTAGQRRIWQTAERLVPRAGNPAWTFNQAIMELGARICTARVVRCGECPVRRGCRTGARAAGM
ncbi:MAG: A/G-specific adenine glycosylase [Gemmatimonadota bacterium]|nr:A/G-specific adenine glycosylase [Gemmatimonadota bacterium]MDH5283524.1 A/G-specific adenine glycosylase [Gemmatimonadota bacterium]